MTTCGDPYRELELYLEEAQEEVGRAVQELEQHEEAAFSSQPSEPVDANFSKETLLPPPREFCSPQDAIYPTVRRVCHDGNVFDFKNSSNSCHSTDNSYSYRTFFSSTLGAGTLGRYRRSQYSPDTKRRLWQMHPSVSFPETSKDLLLLRKDSLSSKGDNNDVFTNSPNCCLAQTKKHIPETRRRSNSETSASRFVNDDPFVIPRPPSGDVNLLSIWANNLVLELNKSFSEELDSTSSFSPSSDYSLSPTKVEDVSEANNNTSCFGDASSQKFLSHNGHIGSRKLISASPDSGIEPISAEDSVDNSAKKTPNAKKWDLIIPDTQLEHITRPPPEFDDSSKTESAFRKIKSSELRFRAAIPVCEVQETYEVLENAVADLPQVIAPQTLQLDDCLVVETRCALNHPFTRDDILPSDKLPVFSLGNGDRLFCSLPKAPKLLPNGLETWSCSLPRDSGKEFLQRSVSQSAVSSMDRVSIEELASFVRQMKSQPPLCADVSTDVKDDNENKDAVTQTTPLPLSRSSSFTWVTECNCSDWDLHHFDSGSEDSLMAECSNCKAEKKTSSSSSFAVSSDDEECEPASPHSGSSSLYLSACSGSSDSFEESTLAEEVKEQSLEIKSSVCSVRRNEPTLRGPTLSDISEEQATVSIKSTVSNPVLTDTNKADPQEQSASFPSTLKAPKKSKLSGSPEQPIEPTVLIVNELNLKSVSAPVLMRQKRHAKVPESSSSDSSPPTGSRSKDALTVQNQVPARAHSAKELNELQAIEACSWLRAAGFPQYAQMYEDNQFPIDICMVQKDHAFLPPDSIQSLFRRLNTLNRCAKMKFGDHSPNKSLRMEESDEEEQYALSENWEFQRSSRRWSRIPAIADGIPDYVSNEPPVSLKPSANLPAVPGRKYLSPEEVYCSSHDSVFVDEQHSSPDSIRRSSVFKCERISASPTGHIGDCSPGSSSGSGGTLSLASEDVQERRNLRRSGSDRVKEGAKALLKRMESLKGKKKKKVNEASKVESSILTHSGTDGSSSSSLASSPQFCRSQKLTVNLKPNHVKGKSTVNSTSGENPNAHSDSECRSNLITDKWKDANSNNTKHFKPYFHTQTSVTITAPDELPPSQALEEKASQNNLKPNTQPKKNFLHPDSQTELKSESYDKRGSFYDNICAPLVVFNELCTANLDSNLGDENAQSGNSGAPYAENESCQNQDDGEIIIINTERRDSGVGSSLTRGITYQQAPCHCFPINPSGSKPFPCPAQVTDLTAPQILLLRKLSLLKLTAVMEKFSPSSRTGWSWAVPKFIRRIRNPDYKDKVVFGVPLLLILQRTGQPLPVSIQAAIHHLRKTALDSTGLFRKSGVRSRIQKLKNLNESNPEKMSYEEQQAYDVADMLKQYFRELPEALLTNKLSETFICIFQYIPEEQRLEAIQAALMLMPDENREVLQVLLEFLHEVCQHSDENQMTATNLAVCFAPSLFHLSTPRSASSSPRRRKTVGVPDLRELNENRAAYECLSCMVTNYKTLFSVSEEMISRSRVSSAAFYQPATLDEFSSFISNDQGGLKDYIDSCVQMVLKECKDKYKGWINIGQTDHVDLSYKKLSDGHPLRLWKVSTEVEAPPVELLNRILRERHSWDTSFTKWKVVARLNSQTEIFQYLSSSLPPHPSSDFCLLRSWRTDLPKGACVLIETSVNHAGAEIIPGSVRALSLASRYLIEPCGSGKSRITHLSRVDTRGRSPEWYNRAYGHICTLLLIKLRNSFSHTRADGPETKV